MLSEAYQSEITVQRQGQMLQLKQTGDAAEFQRTILGDRLSTDSKENGIGINEIIEQGLERVISRFLNQDNQKLMDLRDHIGSIKKKNIEDWKKSFEDDVLYNE